MDLILWQRCCLASTVGLITQTRVDVAAVCGSVCEDVCCLGEPAYAYCCFWVWRLTLPSTDRRYFISIWFIKKSSADIKGSYWSSVIIPPGSCLIIQQYYRRWSFHIGSKFWGLQLTAAPIEAGTVCGFIPRHSASRQSLIIVPFLLPRLPPPPPFQQVPLTAMPPGSAASIRPGGHVKGSKAVCHHTHAQKSISGFHTRCISFLSVTLLA